MTPQVEQLVRDVREVTGAASPLVLEGQAPIVDDQAIDRSTAGGFFIFGLGWGK
jgi:hypothetical protein